MTIESNPKYLDAVLELLGLEGAKDVPTPSVLAHKEKLTTGEMLSPGETTVYRQCVGGLFYYTQDRADAQYEVSVLGSMLGKPTQGSMIALKRLTRYLKGTRHFVNKLELDTDVDTHVTGLDGFSDSDWASSTDSTLSLIATSSGMAEFYAGCAIAEEMLLARDVLMFFGCPVEASLHMDSAAARGICRREGVRKVKSLEVRTLWLQQVVKAKTFTLKKVKSLDNCADFGTKTLIAGTLSLLRNLNGLVDKNTVDNVSCGVQSVTISPGESWMLRATALEALERMLDEIARNSRVTSRSEKMMRVLEPGQLYAMCANSLQGLGHVEVIMTSSKTIVVRVLFQ